MRWQSFRPWPVILSVLAGCSSLPHAGQSAISQTHLLVPGSLSEVSRALTQEMARRQYTVVSQSETQLVFDRPIDNAALWAALDGAADRLPMARVVVSLAPTGTATKLDAQLTIIAARGTAQEHIVEASTLGVDPRLSDILRDTQSSVIAERGTSDPRVAFSTARIVY